MEATQTKVFNDATQQSQLDECGFLASPPDSKRIEALLNVQFSDLLKSAVELEKARDLSGKMDGRIIGTGEADFTKSNTTYTLNHGGKTFQLIDVPGIEGDESKYTKMVREAVAKAHLVFFVNGTNKKPEKKTAEKIRAYLRHGTQVCPLVNVRGSADAYEFEEDRVDLETNSDTSAALQQTMTVLESTLGKQVLLPGIIVQGLLSFSSLAINRTCRKTSIHPTREHDLVIQQCNYFKHFASAKEMHDFSRIQDVASVLNGKLETFKEDIIESNKTKVRELLSENISTLNDTLTQHKTFMERVEPEFKKCRDSVNKALLTFERLITSGRKNLFNEFFTGLIEDADAIIDEHFGDKDTITAKFEQASNTRQDSLREGLQKQFDESIQELQNGMNQALERLIQDVNRIEFLQNISFNEEQAAVYRATDLDMDLSLKNWGAILLNIASYTATGAVIGGAIGAVAGALVGILVSLVGVFSGKKQRIRKAQTEAQKVIELKRNEVVSSLSEETKGMIQTLREEVREKTLTQIDGLYDSLKKPLVIIEQQIALMTNIKKQVEEMPHGTIQAIQY